MFYRFACYKNDSFFKYLFASISPGILLAELPCWYLKLYIFLLQAYPMNYPTNLLCTFAVVCSWRILGTKIVILIILANRLLLKVLSIVKSDNWKSVIFWMTKADAICWFKIFFCYFCHTTLMARLLWLFTKNTLSIYNRLLLNIL